MARTPAFRVVPAADGVFLIRGPAVNWALIADGDALTLVDGGYPAYADAVEASIRAVGRRPADVAAVLVTHGHVDHIGSLARFAARHGAPVYAGAAEVPHVRRAFLQQVTPARILRNAWRPRVPPWVAHLVRAGALRDCRVEAVRPLPPEGPLDVPGRPVPVPTPGHTSGHLCYHLPGRGVLVTGDALVTGHPLSRLAGPQPLPSMFDHDRSAALASMAALRSCAADTLLPGHGPLWRGTPEDAVTRARDRAELVW
ncbi:MBL fold metallo-hydrolase [Streptomonospora nanhaiensis]|uniref:MBL fold metallo-hydrolase n=1 Tax=Streptomonospora nanhaiensis TaxID=1323731 RepID=UPI001C38A53E|nr:MBL fold metallo-hydrolase [Streptomonospora nanhaiensis]MBV2366512.1 MBL fold metallo-hydrolase [Streptomonospora nanhaiensis]MBX9391925.1 MBL fold metallo-hydrolase [Streptomonospora nanhaiensis]